ncbi:MAG: hypothetical protein HOD90_10345 [Nitrospina sp.]|jgi:hypothetical protein|nr:hypothetical protein [Nitrospina sp.]
MKLTFRIIAWVALSFTHVIGSIQIFDTNYIAYILGFVGVVILYERLLMS